jgi:hypothetical protein
MELLLYSEDNLAYSLSNEHTTIDQIKNKNHFRYLKDYFAPSNPLQIVIEKDYINKDYLSDYSSYYSSCFVPYAKICKRVHFFSLAFSLEELNSAIISGDHDLLWNSYLGFVVVKPIPVTVIGFTLFKTYPEGERKYFGTRDYIVHFFGKEIPVRSLAFQEQDSVLSACATSAIWAMLQKASLDYHTTLKTPNEITQLAGLTGPDGSRLFPNKEGLSVIQMCEAIVEAGLVTEIRQIAQELDFDDAYLRELISAYSGIGIPIILVISVLNTDERRKKKEYSLHAVTVSGYNQNDTIARARNVEMHILSEAINKLYVHDDQWGPFARMELSTGKITGPWDLLGSGYTNIESVLIPLFPKIRIAYEDIKNVCTSIDKTLFYAFPALEKDFTWEYKLELSENYKKTIRLSTINDDLKFSILTKSFPKYIWRATVYYTEIRTFDIVFDATDVAANMFALDLVFYESSVQKYLKALFDARDDFRMLFRNQKYYEFLKASTQ